MGEFVMELWGFMRERKKFWFLPIITVLFFLVARPISSAPINGNT